MTYKTWNRINKPEECDVEALLGDLIFYIGSYVFLVQTSKGINNVLCFKYKTGNKTFKENIPPFLNWCKENELQYLRVEGNSRRYKFLLNQKFLPEFRAKGSSVRFDAEESRIMNRNIFYIKVY